MNDIAQELAAICEQNEGMIRAEDVVEFARNPETALHKQFTWDDSEAARQYRLEQARRVIRINLSIIGPKNTEVRAYVSMYEDRKVEGGGYRRIEDVLIDATMRGKLMHQARFEFGLWRKKYQALKELEPVFAAMDNVAAYTNEVTAIAAD